MPLVRHAIALACDAERLAGARTCPNWTRVIPPSEAQGAGPSSDTGKEMTLRVVFDIFGPDIFDRSFIYISWRNMSCGNQIAQPLRRVRIDLVIIRSHHNAPGPVTM